ncbi:MAG: HNH endonuclease [Pseudobdellovibrionaceae bacterium]
MAIKLLPLFWLCLLLHPPSSLAHSISDKISLLNQSRPISSFPPPTEPYNRRKHFGTWVDDPRDQTCFNTRAQVLIRDSRSAVEFKPEDACSVDAGIWLDPYTKEFLYSHKDVQVDHLVPLKHAYVAGGWRWSAKKRCLYANFMSNSFHLLTVKAQENSIKGDSSPEKYLPPHRGAICEYLQNWLKVKAIWKLQIVESELSFIKDEIRRSHCSEEDFQISKRELRAQQNATESQQSLCEGI